MTFGHQIYGHLALHLLVFTVRSFKLNDLVVKFPLPSELAGQHDHPVEDAGGRDQGEPQHPEPEEQEELVLGWRV